MMTNKLTYISPETTLIALQGVRGVMQEDEYTLSTSDSHFDGSAPARVPARKLYI